MEGPELGLGPSPGLGQVGDNSAAVVNYLIEQGLAPPGICTNEAAVGELETHLSRKPGTVSPIVWALHDVVDQDGRNVGDGHVVLLWRTEDYDRNGDERIRIRFAVFLQREVAVTRRDVRAEPDLKTDLDQWAVWGLFQGVAEGGQPTFFFHDESRECSRWVGYRLVRLVEVPYWDAPMGVSVQRLQMFRDELDDLDACGDPDPPI